MLNNTNQLDRQQLKDLEQLSASCKNVDGSIPNFYPHILGQSRSFPATLLYYDQKLLVGFLSIYFFYDEAIELSLIVHPLYRRRKIATQLIHAILPLIQSQGYQQIIFSSPSLVNNSWLCSYKLTFLHEEYYMERDDLNPLLDHRQNMTFRNAISDDIPWLTTVDEACFPVRKFNSSERFQHLIDGREYQIIIANENNIPVGKAHLRWKNDGATLSDIAIAPEQQGKGLGTALIAHCINLALIEGKPHLNLDVETHNEKALKLYTQLGFVIKNACDYWQIGLDKMVFLAEK